jgi:hypothetical protein
VNTATNLASKVENFLTNLANIRLSDKNLLHGVI